MVELVDAPDSKSGGLRPLGVRVPLPALGFTGFHFGLELAPRSGQLWTRDSSCGCVPPFVVEGRQLTE